ncbi:hypothetical protein VTO42DRAFT_4016 [Malbranchea cinnamomea]
MLSTKVSDSFVDLEKQTFPLPAGTDPELRELRRIIREPIASYASLAALLLQVAHPGVGLGVHDHSEFATRQFDRAEKTAIFVYCMVLGSPEQKAYIKQWVDMVHSRVKGGQGEGQYFAQDADLQLWVAATMYDTMVKMYERVYGPFPPDRAEEVLREFAIFGTALQVPPDAWPKDRAAFYKYYQNVIENDLVILPEAKKVYYHLVHPKVPLVFRPLMSLIIPLLLAIAIPLMPPEIVAGYEMKKPGRVSKMTASFMVSTYRLIPPFIRHAPQKYYMRRTRKMVKVLKERGFSPDMRMRSS